MGWAVHPATSCFVGVVGGRVVDAFDLPVSAALLCTVTPAGV